MGILNTLLLKSNVRDSRWTTVAVFDCSKWSEATWNKVKAAISVRPTQKCPSTALAVALAVKAAVDSSGERVLFTASLLGERPKQDYEPIKGSLYDTLSITVQELLDYVTSIQKNKSDAREALKGLC